MQKVNCFLDNWCNAVFLLVALFILLADQFSKLWIRTNIATGHSLVDLGFLRIINIHNTGAAFGLFPHQSFTLTIIAFIGIPAVLVCAFLAHRYLPFLDNMLGRAVLGLFLGGTMGNLTDRLRFGYVTDFIDFRIWPAFNIADAAITTGIIIFGYCLFRLARADQH